MEQAQNYSINPQEASAVTLQKKKWDSLPILGPTLGSTVRPWALVVQMARHVMLSGLALPTKLLKQLGTSLIFIYPNPNWYIPYRPGVSYIRWSPNGACGGDNVNIVNRATAALYSYTPYQPNQAALNNLYGTGDGCSAYGNRNFWRDFNNWFGSTLDAPYQWDIVSQKAIF